jgi:hypothetical protein
MKSNASGFTSASSSLQSAVAVAVAVGVTAVEEQVLVAGVGGGIGRFVRAAPERDREQQRHERTTVHRVLPRVYCAAT